ncbi:hypothetical protein [Neobacillus vireti]
MSRKEISNKTLVDEINELLAKTNENKDKANSLMSNVKHQRIIEEMSNI